MTDDGLSRRVRVLLGLNSTGLLFILLAAASFAGYLVNKYAGPFVSNPARLFFGVGGVSMAVGLVLIGLWHFFVGASRVAAGRSTEAVFQFTYLIGLVAGICGSLLVTGTLTDVGGGIQFVLHGYVALVSDVFKLDGVVIAHVAGAFLTFFPTVFGLISLNLYDIGLVLWILGLLVVWTRNPTLGFRLQFRL